MGSSDVDLYAVWTDTDDVLIKLTFDNSSDYCADTSGNSNNGIGYNMYYTDDGNGGYAASFNGIIQLYRTSIPNFCSGRLYSNDAL